MRLQTRAPDAYEVPSLRPPGASSSTRLDTGERWP